MGKIHEYKIQVDEIPTWITEWAKNKAERKKEMREQCKKLRELNATR